MSFIRTIVVASALSVAAIMPALADCTEDLKMVDDAMAKATLSDEQKTQADGWKTTATEACTAGKADEAAAPIGELKKLLGLS